MKNILLVCNAGMSTSFLVEKMKAAGTEQGMEANIWAVSDAELNENWEKADVILLGPQVGYLKGNTEKVVGGKIPVEVINMLDYGRVNGAAVLDRAMELIG
ncbi:PTS sugar transporter subunit IIB [Listeria ivanovii]|uniref:Putative PTS betaglucoside-specific enzyme IIB component n=1 Tax=Listeria ivanovii (strain ATCC BAA-678 / PAM 55) TaxID=881621 RepID=G2ZAM5_LISIP|nr:PTS sugar transporter subunit IIB [Listeria ivanovii]AHI54909.1 PTS chitobiose transporter subunit IIB [Listeria ivanovii WSLC3009]AIS64371.1 PTS sugar transporter [Listeria ivanovii subsp. ivanovii]MBC1760248.1 PTS sugar transporter subunit IIB [Listeria ivanovii]MBK3915301.1 PTS sugar transporter subunit IIB [Listeria ivanovii subsp. ivanovii]MBK3922429.1 PTS sugar transporter subunit IIB [Listeria ivanovii subsp. ivanovii]